MRTTAYMVANMKIWLLYLIPEKLTFTRSDLTVTINISVHCGIYSAENEPRPYSKTELEILFEGGSHCS